jgi:hypothetical protein
MHQQLAKENNVRARAHAKFSPNDPPRSCRCPPDHHPNHFYHQHEAEVTTSGDASKNARLVHSHLKRSRQHATNNHPGGQKTPCHHGQCITPGHHPGPGCTVSDPNHMTKCRHQQATTCDGSNGMPIWHATTCHHEWGSLLHRQTPAASRTRARCHVDSSRVRPATDRRKIDTRSEDTPWDPPQFQRLHWGPRQSGRGWLEAREPLAAPLWEVSGSKKHATAMQRCHHGNCTCARTQCHHQWCTPPPDHSGTKCPSVAHECLMQTQCMHAMREHRCNGASAPPVYQGRLRCPTATNTLHRDSGFGTVYKHAVLRQREHATVTTYRCSNCAPPPPANEGCQRCCPINSLHRDESPNAAQMRAAPRRPQRAAATQRRHHGSCAATQHWHQGAPPMPCWQPTTWGESPQCRAQARNPRTTPAHHHDAKPLQQRCMCPPTPSELGTPPCHMGRKPQHCAQACKRRCTRANRRQRQHRQVQLHATTSDRSKPGERTATPTYSEGANAQTPCICAQCQDRCRYANRRQRQRRKQLHTTMMSSQLGTLTMPPTTSEGANVPVPCTGAQRGRTRTNRM